MENNSWLVLAIGNVAVDLENLDFITSNRLSLGQNKDWNPTESLHLKQFKIAFEDNEAIFNTWLKIWLIAHVLKLTHQQKEFDIEENVKKGNYYPVSETHFKVSISIWSRISKKAKTRRFVIFNYWNNNVSIYRSSHPEAFLRKGVMKICSKFTGEHPPMTHVQ